MHLETKRNNTTRNTQKTWQKQNSEKQTSHTVQIQSYLQIELHSTQTMQQLDTFY
jgi:hypothetical protein